MLALPYRAVWPEKSHLTNMGLRPLFCKLKCKPELEILKVCSNDLQSSEGSAILGPLNRKKSGGEW